MQTTKPCSQHRTYIAIDLKSFYASAECVKLSLDPLDAFLVVADRERTEKTICLAVSPALKSLGISGRPRLFEVIQTVNDINRKRSASARIRGKTRSYREFSEHKDLLLDFIAAKPNMAGYIKTSSKIYSIYTKYVSPDDIHVYSIDEVFIDATDYMKLYALSSHDFARMLIKNVLEETGITATCGIGSNLYLAKIAMDIEAKHIDADEDGVRIAKLDEEEYRKKMWSHRPLTDFWRIGKGISKSLEEKGIYTMGDIARCSLGKESDYYNQSLLYKMFGINAELLIDHAWGYESCTMRDIKNYRAEDKSISSGQVLHESYTFSKAKIVIKEMAESLALDLVEKGLETDQITLAVGYDVMNLKDERIRDKYMKDIKADYYGRENIKSAHSSISLYRHTSSVSLIRNEAVRLFESIADEELLIRRITIGFNHIRAKGSEKDYIPDLFKEESPKEKEEESLLENVVDIKKKYGKNAILKATSLMEGATGRERNEQIGGHKA